MDRAESVIIHALATWLAYEYFNEQNFEAILHFMAKDLELAMRAGLGT